MADETSLARTDRRAELLARALLTFGALLPYWPLLTFGVIHVTDDGFSSDIWNGELPGRVFFGDFVREHGVLPTWTSQLCGGVPMIGGEEPLSFVFFTLLQAAAALDALLVTWLLVAAHGMYSLARRLDAGRPGAWLAGVSFALSGYVVAQLKHLAIIGTVVWLPLGFLCLDHALSAASHARRIRFLCGFALVFAIQVLAGFPQSAFICAIAYGAYALYLALTQSERGDFVRRVVVPLGEAACAISLGALSGATLLLPLAALGAVSDRGEGNTFEWATQINYDPRNALTFLLPYARGDVSDGSYQGRGLFWEDYGYVGAATFLLAIYVAVRHFRTPRVRFFLALALAAYLVVLGPATPVFRFLFDYLPGFNLFRFPTRFLILVDFSLCVLAALGLSRLREDLLPLFRRLGSERVLPLVVLAVCAGTELDLLLNQPRQNPMVKAGDWLAAPEMVKALRAEPGGPPRIFTPFHMEFHMAANRAARGWADLRPYFVLRQLVQPNSNLYWNLASADCYSGINARWVVDTWGDHSRGSLLVYKTLQPVPSLRRIQIKPVFVNLMRAYGVTHVISPFTVPALEPGVVLDDAQVYGAHLYRVPNAKRARVVEHAMVTRDTDAAVSLLIDNAFEPDAVVVLSDTPASLASRGARPTVPPADVDARIERDEGAALVVRAKAPRGGYLVVSDTFFPGWTAAVDGKPAPIYRANLSVRAVPLPPGDHRVEFRYESDASARGRLVASLALACIVFALLASLAMSRRRQPHA